MTQPQTSSSLELEAIEQAEQAAKAAAFDAAKRAAEEFQAQAQAGAEFSSEDIAGYARSGVGFDTLARYGGEAARQAAVAQASGLSAQLASGLITYEQAQQQYGAAAAEQAALQAIQERQATPFGQAEQAAIASGASRAEQLNFLQAYQNPDGSYRLFEAVRDLPTPFLNQFFSLDQIERAQEESAQSMAARPVTVAPTAGPSAPQIVAIQGLGPPEDMTPGELDYARRQGLITPPRQTSAQAQAAIEAIRANPRAYTPEIVQYYAPSFFASAEYQAYLNDPAAVAETISAIQANPFSFPPETVEYFAPATYDSPAYQVARFEALTAPAAQGLGPAETMTRGEVEFAASQTPQAQALRALAPYALRSGGYDISQAVRDLPVGVVIDAGFAPEDIDAALEYNAQSDAINAQLARRQRIAAPPVSAQSVPLAEPDFGGPQIESSPSIWQRIGLSASEDYRREIAAQDALRTDAQKRVDAETLLQTFGLSPREATIVANSDDPDIQEIIKSDLLGYVPIVGVTYNWNRLSPAERGFQIALDTASILSLVAGPALKGLTAARAARTLPEINRAVSLARAQDAALNRYIGSAASASPAMEAPTRALVTATKSYADDVARIAALEKDLAAAEARAVRGSIATGRDVSRTYAAEVKAIQEALDSAKVSAIQNEAALLNVGDDFYAAALRSGPRADDPLLRQQLKDSLSSLPRDIRANIQEEFLPVTLRQRVTESPPAALQAVSNPARIANLETRLSAISQRLDAVRQRYPTDPSKWADISADKLAIEGQLIEAKRGGLAQLGHDVQALKFESIALRNAALNAATTSERDALLARLAIVDADYDTLRRQFLARLRDLEDTLEGRGLQWDFSAGMPRPPQPPGGGGVAIITASSAQPIIAPRGFTFQQYRPPLLAAADAQRGAQAFLTPGEITVSLQLGRALPAGAIGEARGIALPDGLTDMEIGRAEDAAITRPRRLAPAFPTVRPPTRRVSPTWPPRPRVTPPATEPTPQRIVTTPAPQRTDIPDSFPVIQPRPGILPGEIVPFANPITQPYITPRLSPFLAPTLAPGVRVLPFTRTDGSPIFPTGPALAPTRREMPQPARFPETAPDTRIVTGPTVMPQPGTAPGREPFIFPQPEPFRQPMPDRFPISESQSFPRPMPEPFPFPAITPEPFPFPRSEPEPFPEPFPRLEPQPEPRVEPPTRLPPTPRPPDDVTRRGPRRIELPSVERKQTIRPGDRIIVVGWRQGAFEPIVNLETGRTIYPRDVAAIPNIADARQSFTVLVRGKGRPKNRKIDMGVTDAFVRPTLRGLSFKADKAVASHGRKRKAAKKAKRAKQSKPNVRISRSRRDNRS